MNALPAYNWQTNKMAVQTEDTKTLEDLIRSNLRLAIEIETMNDGPAYSISLVLSRKDIEGIPQFMETLHSKIAERKDIEGRLESVKERVFSREDVMRAAVSYKRKEAEVYLSEIKKMKTELSGEIKQLEKVMLEYALCLARMYLANKHEEYYTKIKEGI